MNPSEAANVLVRPLCSNCRYQSATQLRVAGKAYFKALFYTLIWFIGAVVIFVDIPAKQKIAAGIACILVLFVGYLWLWFRANGLREINLTIEESTVVIKTGISLSRKV
jgi:protein-S-isoprenylcysteine O-methyltransferase Ste14